MPMQMWGLNLFYRKIQLWLDSRATFGIITTDPGLKKYHRKIWMSLDEFISVLIDLYSKQPISLIIIIEWYPWVVDNLKTCQNVCE